jgi:NAD(P)-dependent dehydrogenase (short-subunit alcohol dehydrogenase family)
MKNRGGTGTQRKRQACPSPTVGPRNELHDWSAGVLSKRVGRLAETIHRLSGGDSLDIANAVVFFASVQVDWITGQVLQVGGGNRM